MGKPYVNTHNPSLWLHQSQLQPQARNQEGGGGDAQAQPSHQTAPLVLRPGLSAYSACAQSSVVACPPWSNLSILGLTYLPICILGQLFATPRTTARQASLSFTISWGLLKLMSMESVMPSNCLVLCCPLMILPSIFPSIRVFNEPALRIRWPKCWSFSFSTRACMHPFNSY